MHVNVTVTNAERPRFLMQLLRLFTGFLTPQSQDSICQPVGSLGRVSTLRQHSFTQNPCVTDIIKVCN